MLLYHLVQQHTEVTQLGLESHMTLVTAFDMNGRKGKIK